MKSHGDEIAPRSVMITGAVRVEREVRIAAHEARVAVYLAAQAAKELEIAALVIDDKVRSKRERIKERLLRQKKKEMRHVN